MHGHARIETWLAQDTRAYLKHLEAAGRKPATVNRVLATLRRFARWAHEENETPFAKTGLPTRGIRELVLPEVRIPAKSITRSGRVDHLGEPRRRGREPL